MKQYSIVDIGKELQKYGLTVGQHSAFGKVGKHAPGSYHYQDKAIDVTDWRPDVAPAFKGGKPINWKQRIGELAWRAKQAGIFTQALGPGDKGHEEHTHLALAKPITTTPEMLEWVATGRRKTPEGGLTDVMPSALSQQTPEVTTAKNPTGNTYNIFVSRSPKQEASAQDLLAEYAKQFMPGQDSYNPVMLNPMKSMQSQIAETLQSTPEFFT